MVSQLAANRDGSPIPSEHDSNASTTPPPPQSKEDDGEGSPSTKGLIKARGTYYPLTAFPTSMPQGPVIRPDASPPRIEPSQSKPNIFSILTCQKNMSK